VNDLLLDVSFPVPTFDDLLLSTHGSAVYSLLDLRSSYHQRLLDEESQWLTTTCWEGDLIRFGVLMEGLKPAPHHFQAGMVQIFHMGEQYGGLLRRHLAIYMDDLFLHSASVQEHAEHLGAVFEVCRARNVKLKREKCVFGVRTVTWLGHCLADGIITPPASYMDKLRSIPKPQLVEDLRKWCGSMTWICKHLPGLQQVLAPLLAMYGEVDLPQHPSRRVRRKGKLKWTPEADQAWEEAGALIAHPEALAVPDLTQPFGICVDASGVGVGAVLMQLSHPNGDEKDLQCWRPCAFYSKKWTSDKERHQPARGLELSGLCRALKYWAHFVRNGKTISIWTDHKSLSQKVVPKAWDDKQIRKMLGEIAVFPIRIRYLPGQLNNMADWLSREGLLDPAVEC
jgi:hypothetical protein